MTFIRVGVLRRARLAPIVAAVLVGGLVAPQSSATSSLGASAEPAPIIDVSPTDQPIPILNALVVAREQLESRSVTPSGTQLFEISKETRYGMPATARLAYERAARRIEQTRPGCNLPWGLLAGIGRVESDHGRYGGSELGTDGVSKPLIRGIALNGVGPVAAIPDTDNGKLDGDKVWDRAVGPMQFIPSTWATAGVDGDRDGTADPNDLDDAALAAAGYLCPASGPIGDEAGISRALFSYNRSDYYVDLVYAFAVGYHTGVFDIPTPPVEPDPEVKDLLADSEGKSGGGAAPGAQEPTTDQGPKQPKSPQAASPAGPDQSSATAEESKPPKPPKSPDPEPSPDPTPEPSPEVLVLKSGTGPWTACGGWCVSGFVLDLGASSQVAATAAADFDGDGAVETNRAEFDGLVGTIVTIQVQRDTAVVYSIQGLGYRNADGSFVQPAAG